jgi:hypothetical protein
MTDPSFLFEVQHDIAEFFNSFQKLWADIGVYKGARNHIDAAVPPEQRTQTSLKTLA